MPAYVDDTIAAIATPPGTGAVAVLRVSGRDARAVATRLLRRRDGGAPVLESHRARLAIAVDPRSGSAIDEVLLLPMLAPRSFTGEDVVEIQCHGGRLITDRILRALLACGARAARPGEFTERAFLNGRLDLCQAEAVADLVEASSDAGRTAAWHQLEGALSRAVAELHDHILDLRALVEAHLDFPEDDLPAEAGREIDLGLGDLAENLRRLAATFARGRLAREGVRVVLLGKPNVGKSSLLNAILGRERALVSEVPGTTRDYLEEPAALGDVRILLCDTAGVRPEPETIERAGIERSLDRATVADLVLVVLDRSRPLDADDDAVREAAAHRPHLVVRNKADLPEAWTAHGSACDVSAQTGLGLDGLANAIHDAVATDASPTSEPVTVTRARHHEALVACAAAVSRAHQAFVADEGLELVACELQAGTLELERLLGRVDAEELLDRIFRRFCIGK